MKSNMKAKVILLPIDLAACPLEVFSFVNRAASETAANVVLLYVSTLNVVVPQARLYAEVAQECEQKLIRLQKKFIPPSVVSRVCVRTGDAPAEIVREAKDSEANVIIMASRARNRWRGIFQRHIAETVVATAPCPVRWLRLRHPQFLPAILTDGQGEQPSLIELPSLNRLAPERAAAAVSFRTRFFA